MDTIEERLPPNSIEAEEAVLGSILIDPDAYYEVARILTRSTDFYSTRNRWVCTRPTDRTVASNRSPS